MATLLHLNGPSGVGKSTIARSWAASRPGTLVLDIDELRTRVSGWEDDFVETGNAVRTAALATISAYLATGRDVVLPQLVVTPSELDRFRRAASQAGARYVGVVVTLAPEVLLARLHSREVTPITAVVRRVIEERGGDPLVLRGRADLLDLAGPEGLTVVEATDQAGVLGELDQLVGAG